MLNPERIESMLRSTADFLRKDTYFSGNYISCILPLLFLKLLSDLRSNNALKDEKLGKDFNLPKEADWTQVKDLVQDVGKELTNIFSSIEKSNSTLQGVFINPDVNQWERLSDRTLKSVINALSTLNFDEDSLKQPDFLGVIYEDLLVKYHSYETKTNVNCLTPKDVTKLMVKFVKPEAEMQVYDPACGSGGMLIEATRHFINKGKKPQEITLWGQEENYELRTVALMNLLLHGASNSKILTGNFIKDPSAKETRKARKFDVIITNPPFGVRNWDNYESKHDISHNSQHGYSPKSSADFVFIQESLEALNDKGIAAMVVPHGVLFRGGLEEEIRTSIIKDDLIEAIIGLPKNLFPTTKIPTAIIIFNKQKKDDRKNKILFIDASHKYESNRERNFLSDKTISKIVCTYFGFLEEVGYSKVASHEEISKYGYVLTISRYVEPQDSKTELDAHSQFQRVQELEAQRNEIEFQMNSCLRELGIEI